MKYLSLIFLLVFSTSILAGDATFTWGKPVPPFDVAVPTGTIIDEYRIYCTVGAASFVITVPGYDTEIYNATGLVPGSHTCFMRSYSAAQNVESVDSNTVTKVIFDDSSPNPPASFVFVPAIQ